MLSDVRQPASQPASHKQILRDSTYIRGPEQAESESRMVVSRDRNEDLLFNR